MCLYSDPSIFQYAGNRGEREHYAGAAKTEFLLKCLRDNILNISPSWYILLWSWLQILLVAVSLDVSNSLMNTMTNVNSISVTQVSSLC